MARDSGRPAWDFPPHAILSPYGAPGSFISWTVRAGINRRVADRPPIRLADPGSAWITVTPPAIASGIWGFLRPEAVLGPDLRGDRIGRFVAVVFGKGPGGRVHPEVTMSIDDAWGHELAGAVDDHRIRWSGDAGSNGDDPPVLEQD